MSSLFTWVLSCSTAPERKVSQAAIINYTIAHAKRCSYLVALALEVISDLGKTGALADTIHTTEYNAIHFALFSCFLDIVKKIEVRLGGENATYGILQCLGHNRRNPME